MARARLLKPGFFTNDDLAEVPALGRLLFQGLWCLADREGRLEDRPKRIKAELLPYDDCDVEALLDALTVRGFITRYVVGQARFIAVVNFAKHQTPHIKEAASTIPAPSEHGASTVRAPDDTETSIASRARAPIPEALTPNPIPEAEAGVARRRARETPTAAPDEPARPPIENVTSVNELTDDRPHDMVAMLCEEHGRDVGTMAPDWVSRQRGIAKALLENGHSIAQVRGYVRYRRTAWNGDEPFDLRHVQRDIGAWELDGMPERAPPRAAVRGHPAPRAARITELTQTTITGGGRRREHDGEHTDRAGPGRMAAGDGRV